MDLPAPVDPSPKPPENMPETSMPPGPSQSTRSPVGTFGLTRRLTLADWGAAVLRCCNAGAADSVLRCCTAGAADSRACVSGGGPGSVLMRSRRDQRKPKNVWPA